MLTLWTPPNKDLRSFGESIDIDEVETAISQSKGDKSPGIDGIPSKVYKLMGEQSINLLCNNFNDIMDKGYMPSEWKEGTIILIHKGGDSQDIGNYRPITLLNADYKILCKVLANRMNVVITDIIPNYQIGFMPRRLLYDNVLMLDLLLQKKTKILNLDFRKAYDSVAHNSLFEILIHLGFPSRFVQLVKTMIIGSTARVMVNGILTNKFAIQTGVKQGDPLSPLLFALVVELLARCSEREDLKIHLPRLGDMLLALLMYADDTCLASLTSIGIDIWIECLDKLALATGLKINVKKTFIINDKMSGREIKELMNKYFRYLGFAFDQESLAEDFSKQLEQSS
ncbi:MAG: reverse transcriptase family protein [Cytophagales bacterium]|nr:reverse transcriptase family protein [Cytophagales bacterium]